MADASRRPGGKNDRDAPSTSLAGDPLEILAGEVARCETCPRLVAWRQEISALKRASFADEEYWGRGVAGFGDPLARVLILGLAPGAHGANRTGRIFTGDRSGDWLFRALHRAGLANQPNSTRRDDGLRLTDAWVTSAVKCAPPENRPTPAERDNCRSFLVREIEALVNLRVVVCLGAFAYQVAAAHFDVRPRPRFGHGVEVRAQDVILVCSFHPSQQNTFTGRLTETMLDDVARRAVELANLSDSSVR